MLEFDNWLLLSEGRTPSYTGQVFSSSIYSQAQGARAISRETRGSVTNSTNGENEWDIYCISTVSEGFGNDF